MKVHYDFSAVLWKHEGQGGWYFVSLPKELAVEIREHFGWQEEGWGRLKASAKIDKTTWETAIWYDKKAETYLLPVKGDIRRKTGVQLGDTLDIGLRI